MLLQMELFYFLMVVQYSTVCVYSMSMYECVCVCMCVYMHIDVCVCVFPYTSTKEWNEDNISWKLKAFIGVLGITIECNTCEELVKEQN